MTVRDGQVERGTDGIPVEGHRRVQVATRFTPTELRVIEELATPKQYEAITLWSAGYGWKRIADLLRIHPTTAKGRVRDGLAKVGLDIDTVR